jgi:hypothetical protein
MQISSVFYGSISGLYFSFLNASFEAASVVYWSKFLATNTEVRVWFPALPVFFFLEVVGLERGRDDNWGAALKDNPGSGLETRN